MEIETIEIESRGDKIIIPEGWKVTINGNEIVVEKEGREFKDGDIIAKNKAVAILKGGFNNGIFRDYASINFNGVLLVSNDTEWSTNPAGWHIATDEEKQTLFAKMKEQGLRWNAEEKQVEKIRWRAPEGHKYLYCSIDSTVVNTTDCRYELDYKMYKYGNYFRTEKQAEEAAKRVKEALRKYHEEIGE